MKYLAVGIIILFFALPATAQVSECQSAIDQYNSAIGDVSDALTAYSNCVSDSQGADDCSGEFGMLTSAQDDFETAVSSYDMDCQ